MMGREMAKAMVAQKLRKEKPLPWEHTAAKKFAKLVKGKADSGTAWFTAPNGLKMSVDFDSGSMGFKGASFRFHGKGFNKAEALFAAFLQGGAVMHNQNINLTVPQHSALSHALEHAAKVMGK